MQADVLGLYIGVKDTHVSKKVDRLECRFNGIQGDRHQEITTLAGVQERHIVDKYRPVANFRQVTIVTKEEMDAVATTLEVPRLYAEDFSANIVLGGISDFTQLPPVYYLLFSNNRNETHAVIRLMGENMEARYPEETGIQSRFVKAALGKRGQVAVVYAEGIIREGDTVTFVSHQPDIK